MGKGSTSLVVTRKRLAGNIIDQSIHRIFFPQICQPPRGRRDRARSVYSIGIARFCLPCLHSAACRDCYNYQAHKVSWKLGYFRYVMEPKNGNSRTVGACMPTLEVCYLYSVVWSALEKSGVARSNWPKEITAIVVRPPE